MFSHSGRADLPLHGGKVPDWLAQRMAKLGRVLCEAIVLEYGVEELLSRLSHPFWFQAFGAVMGMDWHSSGITTSVVGALKRGLAPVADELGIYVCGGRGKHSRQTPAELIGLGERLGWDGAALAQTSRLVAKIDSAAVQDGFQIYLHAFIVARDASWAVVQQGMRPEAQLARRYHWHSREVRSFVAAPHTAIVGAPEAEIVNLVDVRAARSQQAQLELVADPDAVVRALASVPRLHLPMHHEVRSRDVLMRRVHGALAAAAEAGPRDFTELLLVPGVGARTMLSLALAAEIVHGAPCRFSDPARFAFAHGGKDGHPFPVPLAVYDRTLRVLNDAVGKAKIGNADRLHALRVLGAEAQRLEQRGGPTFAAFVANERLRSPDYAGRTVAGPAKRPADAPKQQSFAFA